MKDVIYKLMKRKITLHICSVRLLAFTFACWVSTLSVTYNNNVVDEKSFKKNSIVAQEVKAENHASKVQILKTGGKVLLVNATGNRLPQVQQRSISLADTSSDSLGKPKGVLKNVSKN